MIDIVIVVLISTFIACQIFINKYFTSETAELRQEVERLKNRMMVYDHKQRMYETALDMLFAAKYDDIKHEVRH